MSEIDVENQRLAELRNYEILDTPADGTFDDLTLIATKIFKVPISIVSLVDADRVWFKSASGLDGIREMDRGPGLCSSAIMSDNVYVAHDLRLDPNSLTNPLVATERGFRFYAAEPLKSRSGFNLGTFCVLDTAPRHFTDEDEYLLKCFGRLVMAQMEQRLASRRIAGLAQTVAEQNKLLAHAATHDALTGLLNRRSIELRLAELVRGQAKKRSAIMLLDVDNFKSINDRYGHPLGDAVLVEVSRRISNAVRSMDYVGRYGGEEFVVVIDECEANLVSQVAERIRASIEATPIPIGDGLTLNVTISGGICHGSSDVSVDSMLRLADEALYVAKNAGRNRIVVSSA